MPSNLQASAGASYAGRVFPGALAKLADQLSSCRTVVYEEFCRDCTAGTQSILAGLGHSGVHVAEPSITRMPQGKALDFAERFRAEYRDKFGSEPVG